MKKFDALDPEYTVHAYPNGKYPEDEIVRLELHWSEERLAQFPDTRNDATFVAMRLNVDQPWYGMLAVFTEADLGEPAKVVSLLSFNALYELAAMCEYLAIQGEAAWNAHLAAEEWALTEDYANAGIV